MKRLTPMFALLLMTLLLLPVHAMAAETDKLSSHVNITVVMPESTASPESTPKPEPTPTPVTTPTAQKLYPTGVLETLENGKREIIKTYELLPGENPADIPRDSFERDGFSYFLTDITKKETAAADVREHTEIVTLNTDTKDMEAILRQLAQTLEFTAEDGYTGVLALNVASITVETAGTKSSSYTVSAKREYPHLSSNDTSLVPKTITDGGRTLTLSNVDWKAQMVESIDYDQVPTSYTAYATYTAAASKTVVTGYVTTAEYNGSLSKLSQGKTIYTAYFLGAEILPERTPLEITEPIPTPELEAAPDAADEQSEETEQPSETETPTETETPEEQDADADANQWPLIALVSLLTLLLGAGAGYYIPKIKTKSIKSEGEKAE